MSDQLSAPASRNYIALGDSIATGVNNHNIGYPTLLQQRLNTNRPTILNLSAQSGQTSRQLLKSLPRLKKDIETADIITLNIGGNDLRLAWRVYGAKPIPSKLTSKKMVVTLNTLTNNWNEIISYVTKHAPAHHRLIVLNLYNPYELVDPKAKEYIELANAQLQNLCRMHNLDLIDCYSLLNKPSGAIKRYLSDDNLHLNQAGQEVVSEAIYRLIHPVSFWRKVWNSIALNRSK